MAFFSCYFRMNVFVCLQVLTVFAQLKFLSLSLGVSTTTTTTTTMGRCAVGPSLSFLKTLHLWNGYRGTRCSLASMCAWMWVCMESAASTLQRDNICTLLKGVTFILAPRTHPNEQQQLNEFNAGSWALCWISVYSIAWNFTCSTRFGMQSNGR